MMVTQSYFGMKQPKGGWWLSFQSQEQMITCLWQFQQPLTRQEPGINTLLMWMICLIMKNWVFGEMVIIWEQIQQEQVRKTFM